MRTMLQSVVVPTQQAAKSGRRCAIRLARAAVSASSTYRARTSTSHRMYRYEQTKYQKDGSRDASAAIPKPLVTRTAMVQCPNGGSKAQSVAAGSCVAATIRPSSLRGAKPRSLVFDRLTDPRFTDGEENTHEKKHSMQFYCDRHH